jgi:hypothetical protein
VPGVQVFSTRIADARTLQRYFCVFMDGGDIRLSLGDQVREERAEVFVKYVVLKGTDGELDAAMELAHAAIMASTAMPRPLLTRFDYDMDGEAHMGLVFTYSTLF